MTRNVLPTRRTSWNLHLTVGGQTCFVTFGEFPDGSLGELFIIANKRGTMVRALLDAYAVQFSLGLQHGVPLETAVAAIRDVDFLPQGCVSGAEDLGITQASSILSAIASVIDATYLKKEVVA